MKLRYFYFFLISTLILACEYEESSPNMDMLNYATATRGNGYTGSDPAAGGDRYNDYVENPFIDTQTEPVSTFSVDADGASFSNARRFLLAENTLPPANAIRTEEFINYFDMGYEASLTDPVTVNGEIADCPWQPGNKLIRIGLVGQQIPIEELPPAHYVFLIDVSGSMGSSDKLKLLKQGFTAFSSQMRSEDFVSIVTYAGSSAVLLEHASGSDTFIIQNAISKLGAGGSTAGAQGIKSAYEIAQKWFIEGGNNRVILGTDGDFNVGVSSQDELVSLIEEKRDLGVFLTVLGVGRGNLNDAMMEQVANHGNGTYEYIDSEEQLVKVFTTDMGKFYTVAKDVKVQVKFNPVNVLKYRLIGYENRLLNNEDFENDAIDAAEIGVNQSITALYEIVTITNAAYRSTPVFTIDFRYKTPNSDTSIPIELDILDPGNTFNQASEPMILSASLSAFVMELRNSEYKGDTNYDAILQWIDMLESEDKFGYRQDFMEMVETAQTLSF